MGRLAVLLLLVLAMAGCQASPWHHAHGRDHPLAGAIVDLRSQRLVNEAALEAAIDEASIVLLGDSHGNRDQHRLQARLIRAMGETVSGVVFEAIPADRQEAVVEHLRLHPADVAGLGRAIDWDETVWPDWSLYEPVAAAALAVHAQIVAGDLPRAAVSALMADGVPPLDQALIERTGFAQPLAPEAEDQLLALLDELHCGLAPPEMLRALLTLQRSRAALMADRLKAFKGHDKKPAKSVLIAGTGHVRRDWGVPHYLRHAAPGAVVLSIAFLEVDKRMTELPLDLPYDFVWFTPRRQPVGFDPCDAYHEQLNQLEAGLARTTAS